MRASNNVADDGGSGAYNGVGYTTTLITAGILIVFISTVGNYLMKYIK